ncbi:transcriptional regulator [Candidatus Bathyarchaeota archaeon]|nr:MAG: transcriptional regulator [Candidatus Bathyarchaeota archaeon]
MILPCEIAVKAVVPAIKATLATELVQTYGFKQAHAAEILGISQSAVSKYTRQVRGHLIEIGNMGEIKPLITDMVNLLVDENPKRTEFLGLFCQTCRTIREKGLMCQFCKKTDPMIKAGVCYFCLHPEPTG